MGAKGPHDDFETARKIITAGYANFNVDQDLDAIRDRYLGDDLEYVTRLGTFHGPERFVGDLRAQVGRWTLQVDLEEVIDAGEGAVLALATVSRIDPDSGEVEWKAWPGAVMRIHGGRMVFFEGYVDRRKALAEYGLERG